MGAAPRAPVRKLPSINRIDALGRPAGARA
jgi:hypothetical protein